jgi:hypothetical protein
MVLLCRTPLSKRVPREDMNTSPIRVLTKLYKTQDYWVFGLCPSSSILKDTKEHSISEIGSVSIFR